jgi:molybdopterin molybdotransferase
MKLTALESLMGSLLEATRPTTPVAVPIGMAVGLPLAEALTAKASIPPRPLALRSGLAVAALDLVGASVHTPVPLSAAPPIVSAGDDLPAGCDAIVDPATVIAVGASFEALEPVEPGAHMRHVGHDLAAGEVIAAAGVPLSREGALAAQVAGYGTALVRRPIVRLDWPGGPERDWLSAQMGGLAVAQDDGAPDLILRVAEDPTPRLALRPGDMAWAQTASGTLIVDLPPRFDGMIAGWCALALPLLARLMELELAAEEVMLTRKVVSTVGIAEVALFERKGSEARLLGVGDLTLSAIAAADCFALVPANSEGSAAGDRFGVVPLATSLRPRGTVS